MSHSFFACAWCGCDLPAQQGRGRKRKFCGNSCKQRAYEQRNNVAGSSIHAESLILHPDKVAAMRDKLFELRCSAEDIATAHAEGADTQEISRMCEELTEIARELEKLR
ncbi:hypothetical protein [Corynebacterium mayonis]|uniref:hypothetical protein n=1 Tax=Corynebacterium mayonis TaxID=3062461 RepID=UPI003140C8F5